MDTEICCFILPTTRPEAFLLQLALILTTTYHISALTILGIQIRFLAGQLQIFVIILITIAQLDNFMYDFKTEIGCMHFKDAFITENVFLLLHSEQIKFWLLKLIQKSILIYKKLEKNKTKPSHNSVNFGNIFLSFRKLHLTTTYLYFCSLDRFSTTKKKSQWSCHHRVY